MASNLSNGEIPPDGAFPATKVLELVDGYIDMEILDDIHMSLRQSEKGDDIALAAWIKQSYLQEPLNEIGRPIRNAEGYANLDKAYRRVRQLTGKAKDKWPFFDRTWKKLSSTVVKNAILGNNPTDTPHSGRLHDTPAHNGFEGQLDRTSQTQMSQIPHNANKFDVHTTQKQKLPQSPSQSPAPQNATQPKAHRKEHSSRSESDGISMVPAESEAIPPHGTVNGATPPVDALRDAGAGKVRGPHGRYVNKSKSSSPAGKKSSKVKQARKSKSRTSLGIQSEEDDVSSDEGVKTPEATLETTSISSEGERDVVQSGSEPPKDTHSIEAGANDLQLPVSAILAAEAEAVPSSLDRLPPGFTHKKRKSESSIDRGGLKRPRGSRGGVLGRPRKSETLAVDSRPASEERANVGQSPTQLETPIGNSRKTARRSSRKSAAADLERSTPWDPTSDVLFNGAGPATNGNHQTIETPIGTHQKTKYTKKGAANDTPASTTTNTFTNQPSKVDAAFASAKQEKRVSFSPANQADDVQFFARITTRSGTKDVPLLEEDLTTEVNLVKRYAAWQKAGNTDASFEVFKNIAHFTR